MKITAFILGMAVIFLTGAGALSVTGVKPSRLIIGDSIAAAWNIPNTVNGGIGGSTSDDVLYNWRQKYRDGNWQTVIVLVGTNDIGAGMSFDGFKDHIRQLLWDTQHRGIKLILCSILPTGANKQNGRPNDQIYAWNKWLQEFSVTNDLIYLDFYSPMIDGAYLRSGLSEDDLHPNKAGYAIMESVLAEAGV